MKTNWKKSILTAFLMIFFLIGLPHPFGSNHVEATSTAKLPKTAYQTTANLNLRTGTSTKYSIILSIPKSKIIYATEKKGGWVKVSYTYTYRGKKLTKSGWVSSTYMKEYYQYIKTKGTYYFSNKTAYLYPAPDTKKKAAYKIAQNNGFYSTQQIINSVGQTWYRVSYNGRTLYVKSSSVAKVTPKTFAAIQLKAKANTVIYQAYGKSYKALAKIGMNQILSASKIVGDFYKVTYNGITGYIYKDDFEQVIDEEEPDDDNPDYTEIALSGKTFLMTADTIARKTPAESSAMTTTVSKGKIVIPTHQTSNGWYKVAYSGKIGYVNGNTLQEVTTGDPLDHHDGYQFIDLRTKSRVTAAQINNYISAYEKLTGKTSVLHNKGSVFIQAGDQYGVNALYLAAHAIHESAYGTSNISLGKFNLFGFAAYDATPFIAAYRFQTVDDNIMYIAQELKATYLNPKSWKYQGAYLGFSTKTLNNTRVDANSEGMNFYYASDPKWGVKIAAHMQNILPYNKADYTGAAVDTRVFANPPIPTGSEVFPASILAVAKMDLELKLKKGDTASVITLKKGKEFVLLEKTNDFWVRVQYEGKTYWISIIKFDHYNDYLSVKNLGRVNVDGLNVRPDPSTANAPIATLSINQYVQLVLDSNGNLTMDPSKTWYKVKLSSEKIGWVSASYLTRELK
ncbi:SH3 domain-containing protein [Cytobacillus sp. Hz8]|uniref:SH3 domain-containing protein n=1 Tax=Cytobacillus sp. Hz8 TaxID=3347168 RepID=UPI0035E24335